MKSVAVFCGSSSGNDKDIRTAAQHLGRVIAERDIRLVYGGSKIGIMGITANAVLEHNGLVCGVIPEFLKRKEVVHDGLQQLITTENMHERKLQIQEASDGFIALPGGFGTFEELFEIITWAQLGLHQKPIGLLNVNHFYDNLLRMLDTMVEREFLKMDNRNMLIVDHQVEGLLDKMAAYTPKPVPKWLDPETS